MRNALTLGPGRKAQANAINKARGILRRKLATLKLQRSRAQGPRIKRQVQLIEHCRTRYGDNGEAARTAWERASSEVRALALDGSDETLAKAIGAVARRKGTAPGPDGIPCEHLWALGQHCIPFLNAALAKRSADMGHMAMPAVWQISRLAIVLKSVAKRSVAQLRLLGLVAALQEVVAVSLMEAALEDQLPQTVNAYDSELSGIGRLAFHPRCCRSTWRMLWALFSSLRPGTPRNPPKV